MNTKFDLTAEITEKIFSLDIGQIDGTYSLSISIEDMQEMIPRFPQGDYDHIELSYFISGLIDLHLFNDAVDLVEQLIILGEKYYAGVLADDLYDTNRLQENDALWHKYMTIAGEGHYTTFELNFSDWRAGENQCGLWIAGHHSSDFYIEGLFGEFEQLDYDKAKIEPLVTQAYLQKRGNNLFLKDKVEDGCLPITTVFSPELDDVISDLY